MRAQNSQRAPARCMALRSSNLDRAVHRADYILLLTILYPLLDLLPQMEAKALAQPGVCRVKSLSAA